MHDKALRVPHDVAVIGVDDIETAPYLTPALTTISLPKERIGEKSAEMLIKLIEKQEVDEPRILLKPELVLRETT
jgi:DNA-binding LacI/PurR family transcriptional regulator